MTSPSINDVFRAKAELRQTTQPKTRARKPKRAAPPPFSLRLTSEERALLERMAGSRPLGTFIRDKLFGDRASRRKHTRRRPGPDQEALARVLGELGRSRLASNMNQIAKAAHIGALPVSEELETELRAACADIRKMRQTLIEALGIAP